MKNIISVLVILVLVSVINLYVNAQKTFMPILKVNSQAENNESNGKRRIFFTVENLSPELKVQWQNSAKEHVFISKMKLTESKNSNIQNGEIILISTFTLDDIKKLIEGFGLPEFYFGDIKILTKTVFSDEVAKKKAMDYVFKDYHFTKECNDSTLIDYYDFQIYYLTAKIQLMWSNNYSKYLFDGNVTKYTENLDKMIIRRENFIKNKK